MGDRKAINRKYNQSQKARDTKARRPRQPKKPEVRGRQRHEAMQFIHALKSVPCMDCGSTFPAVCMDFDHRPGEIKSFGVGREIHRVSLDKLKAEIAKCDVVCANCHRIRTHIERDHRSLCLADRKPTQDTQLGLPGPFDFSDAGGEA